jgi:hypothetical protein
MAPLNLRPSRLTRRVYGGLPCTSPRLEGLAEAGVPDLANAHYRRPRPETAGEHESAGRGRRCDRGQEIPQ